MKIWLCILFSAITISIFGQQVTITPDEDWRIVSSNRLSGFNYYYNPDKIWKKDSSYTCVVRLLIDAAKLKEFRHKLESTEYKYSIYRLQIDCVKKQVKIIERIHYDNAGEILVITQKKNNPFVLNTTEKKAIITNTCRETKYGWFDSKRESPF